MSNHSNGRKKKRKLGDSKESSEASKSSGSIRLNEGAGQRGSVPSYSKLIGQKKLTASDGSGIKAQASNVMVQSNNRVEPVGGKRKRDEPNFPPSTKSPGAVSNPKPSGVFPASSVSNSHSAHRSTPSSGALKLAPTSSIEKSKQDKKRKYSESSSDSDSSSSSNNSTSASSSEDDSEAHKREKPVTKKHKMSRVKDDQSVKIGSNAAKAERERLKKIAQAKAAKAERERLEKIAQDKAAKAERERLVKQAAASEKARSKAFSSQMGTIQNSRRPNDKEIPNFEISKPDDWKTLSEKMKQGDNPAWMNVSLDFKYMKSVKKHSFSLNDKRHDPASQKSNLLYHDNREGDKSIFYSRDRLAKKGGGTLGSLIGYHDKRKSKEEANFLDTKESSLDSEIARNTLRVMRSETNLDSTLSESLLEAAPDKNKHAVTRVSNLGLLRSLRIGSMRQTSERGRDLASVSQLYPLLYQIKHREHLKDTMKKSATLRTIFGPDAKKANPLGGLDAAAQAHGAEAARGLTNDKLQKPWLSLAMTEIWQNYASKKHYASVNKTFDNMDDWIAHKVTRAQNKYLGIPPEIEEQSGSDDDSD